MNRPDFKVSVFGIIINDQDQVLLCLRNDYDVWNLPGGGLEKGEAPWEGVIREITEETGINVNVSRLVGVYSKPQKDEIVFIFECSVVGGKLTLTDEARDIKYFSKEKIPSNTVEKQVERINDYFNSAVLTLKKQTGPSFLETIQKDKLPSPKETPVT